MRLIRPANYQTYIHNRWQPTTQVVYYDCVKTHYVLQYNFDWLDLSWKFYALHARTECEFNKGNASYIPTNDFTRSSEDENKNTINKIYARLAVVARVDLWDASYSFRDGACVCARAIARMR